VPQYSSQDPAARIILVSGWSPSYEVDNSGAIGILAKPVRLERLEAALKAVAEMLPLGEEASVW